MALASRLGDNIGHALSSTEYQNPPGYSEQGP